MLARLFRFRTKIMLSLLMAGLLPAAAMLVIDMTRFQQAERRAVESELRLVNDMKDALVATWFSTLVKVGQALAENPVVLSAMTDLRQGSDRLVDDQTFRVDEASFRARYDYQASHTRDAPPDALDRWMQLDEKARRLQHLYVSGNPQPVGQKHRLDDAGDGSAYSAQHRKYHPFLRSYLERFGFYDIFLIDPRSGSIVYTVFKETDFGTSLFNGPYRETAFGRAAKAMAQNGGRDPYVICDFEPYAPSYNVHAAFLLLPLHQDGALIGILAFQIPIEPLNDILRKKTAGFDSSDGYLVGADSRLRSVPLRDQSLEVGSPVSGPIISAALSGGDVTVEGTNYAGQNMVAAVRSIPLAGLTWGIVSEISADEAIAGARAALRTAGVTAGISGVVILVAGLLVSIWLLRPIRILTSHIQDLAGKSVAALKEASGSARESAEAMVMTAGQTSRQSRVVKDSSGRAATNVSTVASAVEEMSASASEVVQGVSRTSGLIDEANRRAEAARVSLADLESATQRIRGVVTFIEGIARQTDLLALNAAVEAARAGEAGRGFSVVAEEVRKLAAMTTRSTGEIAAEVMAVASAVEQNVSAIRGISDTVGKVYSQAQMMSVAAREQGEVAAQIASRMAETAHEVATVDSSVAGVETAAADSAFSATEMMTQMERVDKASAEMGGAVTEFVEKVRSL